MTTRMNINYLLFFAVLASSMIGAQVLGVSLAKISLIPLEMFLFVSLKDTYVHFTKDSTKVLLWLIFVVFSSFYNYVFSDSCLSGYKNVLLFNVFQNIIFHIPILLLLSGKSEIFCKLKKSILIVAQINCVWAIVQFIAWYVFRFDFNNFFFNTLLHGFLGSRDWTAWNYETLSLAIRPTGLNHDPAFLALLLVLGFIITSSKLWKYLFFVGVIAAMSRVGIVSIAIFVLFERYRQGLKIKFSQAIIGVASILLFAGCALFMYNNNEHVRYQMDLVSSRFEAVTGKESANTGTNRHMMYIPAAILTSMEMPLVNSLIGTGPRTGGNAFAQTEVHKTFFSLNKVMREKTWAVECDPAELLLGCGLVGFILYYLVIFSFIKKFWKNIQDCSLFMAVLFFGVMYDVSMHPLITLLIIVAAQEQENDLFVKRLRHTKNLVKESYGF